MEALQREREQSSDELDDAVIAFYALALADRSDTSILPSRLPIPYEMRDRSFADFMIGALACVSVFGFYAFVKESEELAEERRRRAEAKWTLPRKRRRRQTPEDNCRHCAGSGACANCTPSPCRVCRGTGTQPRDEALVTRLVTIWDGVS